MAYYCSKTVNLDFDEAVSSVTQALKKEVFGILTDIDVKSTIKKKLDVDFRNYRILGARNPPFAYKALQEERRIGTMLPCNVIVQETEAGQIEVSAIDPIASMRAIENPKLREIADQIQAKLKKVVEHLYGIISPIIIKLTILKTVPRIRPLPTGFWPAIIKKKPTKMAPIMALEQYFFCVSLSDSIV
ncbi:MAG: DUF302 domain-containing protein [Desulfobacterales bacterium]|nr:DUF302 domain-containing protein [Desulfobacterales bacterium]